MCCVCKNPIKHCIRKEDYTWNPCIWACESDKHYEIDEYLPNCTCVKGFVY